jgi:hypothetical protein
MAETDELIGAEKYFISNARDYATAQRFLSQVSNGFARKLLYESGKFP